MLKHLFEAAVTFIVVIDPVGAVPLFLTATQGRSLKEQQKIALKATIISAMMLIFFLVFGQLLFDRLGIKLYAFKIAGGLVLLLVSLQMVLAKHSEDGKKINPPEERDVAIFPIALPYIAGPGTIMAVVLQTDNDLYTIAEQAAVGGVLLVILFATFLILHFASYFFKVLGNTGIDVVTRIMGLILASMAVQTIITGISGCFRLNIIS